MTTADYRDFTIAEFADSEVVLIEQILSLRADIRIYREIAQVAIHQLHDFTQQVARLRRQHHQLVQEYRALSARSRRQGVAA